MQHLIDRILLPIMRTVDQRDPRRLQLRAQVVGYRAQLWVQVGIECCDAPMRERDALNVLRDVEARAAAGEMTVLCSCRSAFVSLSTCRTTCRNPRIYLQAYVT